MMSEFVRDGQKYRNVCKKCKCEHQKQARLSNVAKYKAKDKAYYEANKHVVLEKNRQYRRDNRDQICAQKKQYYNENKPAIKEYHANNKEKRNAYKRSRFETDIMFRITERMKSRLHIALKNVSGKHSSKLLGCSKDHLMDWIGFQFENGLNWDNYGTAWHIDHVIPVSFFDVLCLEARQYAFHWTNTRPLGVRANLTKSSKILKNDILQHLEQLKSFPGYQGKHESGCWQRVELWHGKNPEDEESFTDFLKWATRSQHPKSEETMDTGVVQRLDDNGSEVIGLHQ